MIRNVAAVFAVALLLAAAGSAVGQEPRPEPVNVVVGLVDGQQLFLEDARFNGFIATRAADVMLYYRQPHFRGELRVDAISRVEIGYERGEGFPLALELRDGTRLEASSDRRAFLEIQGRTDTGEVLIRHPDPLRAPPDSGTRSPDREDDLTIRYLEFP